MLAPRSLLAAAGPAVAFAITWGALESPTGWGALAVSAVLGAAPAVVRPRVLRWCAATVALVAGLSLAFSVSPARLLPGVDGTWLGELADSVRAGLRGFEVIVLPFDPGRHEAMHGLVLTAVLCFALSAALSVGAGRPLLASAVVVVGGGWATASMPDERLLVAGGTLLVAALWPPVVLRVRARRDALAAVAATAAIGVVALGAASAGAAPDDAMLGWRSWSVVGDAQAGLPVRYVWDAQYGGIEFPRKATTVLRVRGPGQAHYWRASTLDLFTADRWIENLYPVARTPTDTRLPDDPLLPAGARSADLVRQTVEVVALDDAHLVAAGEPVRVSSEVVDSVFVHSGGVLTVRGPMPEHARYTVWSYVPQPTRRELLRSRPDYPEGARRYLRLDRAVLPPFGASVRGDALEALLGDDRYRALWPYRPLWRTTRRLTRTSRTPYEATLAIERWLRTTGGFTYDEHPPDIPGGAPALVDFVMRYRSGYCQHFAGAMALMLRFAGIPARVAVGFTSGRRDGDEWVVSNVDAHAWVEAWFAGQGWVPFDPTPDRGTFTASYTLASDSAEDLRALRSGDLLGGALGPDAARRPDVGVTDGGGGSGSRSSWPALAVAAVLLAPLALLFALKTGRRRLRYLAADPRRVASAARSELVETLQDQGVALDRTADTSAVRTALEQQLGVPAGAFAEAHARARWGPPEGAALAAEETRRELRQLRRILRERLGAPRRLRGLLSVRSLRRA